MRFNFDTDFLKVFSLKVRPAERSTFRFTTKSETRRWRVRTWENLSDGGGKAATSSVINGAEFDSELGG